jgi:hypothetical protein
MIRIVFNRYVVCVNKSLIINDTYNKERINNSGQNNHLSHDALRFQIRRSRMYDSLRQTQYAKRDAGTSYSKKM